MPTPGFTLILGAVFGIISSLIIYAWDWKRMNFEMDELKRINQELVKMIKEERAMRKEKQFYEKNETLLSTRSVEEQTAT